MRLKEMKVRMFRFHFLFSRCAPVKKMVKLSSSSVLAISVLFSAVLCAILSAVSGAPFPSKGATARGVSNITACTFLAPDGTLYDLSPLVAQ